VICPSIKSSVRRLALTSIATVTIRHRSTASSRGILPLDPATNKGVGTVVGVDPAAGNDRHQARAFEQGPPPSRPHRSDGPSTRPPFAMGCLRVADHVIAQGMSGSGPYRAVRDLLQRLVPRLHGLPEGEPLRDADEDNVAAARRLALVLEETYLPVQGPPGSGKTFTGAR